MTRKDYVAIARAVSFARIQSLDNHCEGNENVYIKNPIVISTIRQVVDRLCMELCKDNNRFDEDRFIEACGLTI